MDDYKYLMKTYGKTFIIKNYSVSIQI